MANCEGCFTNCGGSCGASVEKPLGKCRFYKTEMRLEKECRESVKRLNKIGRSDLIFKYLSK